jgi:2-polyprenyl-3-methyl-5-hydroxy-6-metoxy-1,4-benzoquinol methylase
VIGIIGFGSPPVRATSLVPRPPARTIPDAFAESITGTPRHLVRDSAHGLGKAAILTADARRFMHQRSEAILEFTGERVVLGRSDHAVEEYELEHVTRYSFARTYARGRFVVDVACGTGYGSAILAAAGARMVHGYDVDSASIEFASREWAGSGVSFAVADACRLPEDDATIDAVVTFETIEHLSEPSVFVEEIARIFHEAPGTLATRRQTGLRAQQTATRRGNSLS